MPNQISLFTENKKGALHAITAVLADANININTMLTNDSAEYGIVRLIVDRPEEAIAALKAAGYQCRLDQVLAVHMPDDPGSLDKILKTLSDGRINIDYLYISYDRYAATPIAVIKTSEPEAEAFLRGRGYQIADQF